MLKNLSLKMNYLAHAYFSFNHPGILIGNMISDYVKGKKKFEYPERILQGIMLHRRIDTFTDEHEATKAAKVFFKPAYRLYSGAMIDVVYDHFLANDTTIFKNEDELIDFGIRTCSILNKNFDILPERFKKMLPYMTAQKWLFNYRFRWGIQQSFRGVAYRAKFINESEIAFALFNNNYYALKECYNHFINDVNTFTRNERSNLLA
ncbi:MAG: ACP phosphodiesterase [Ginsengibacter sp.]